MFYGERSGGRESCNEGMNFELGRMWLRDMNCGVVLNFRL